MLWAVLVMFVGPMALAPKTTNLQFALVVAQPILLFLSAVAGLGKVAVSIVFAIAALLCINGFLVSARGNRDVLDMLWTYQELAILTYLHLVVCIIALAWHRFLLARMPPPDDRSLPSIRDLQR
jgi:hypothetical protein